MDQYLVFFFQAEDGIRDVAVTGVQTCALPIYRRLRHVHGTRSDRLHVLHDHAARREVERDRRRGARARPLDWREHIDRKSTRLNSSHGYISYAVFCLKKKKKKKQTTTSAEALS